MRLDLKSSLEYVIQYDDSLQLVKLEKVQTRSCNIKTQN